MISVASVEQAGICPTILANSIKIRSSVLGAGAFVFVLFSGSAAQAQCTSVGLNGLNATAPVVAQAAGMAVANVSASVGTLITSINSVNTAFLTQRVYRKSGQSSTRPARWRRLGARRRRPSQCQHNRNGRKHKFWHASTGQHRLQHAHPGRFRRRSDRHRLCQAERERVEFARRLDNWLHGIKNAGCHSRP